MFAWFQEMPIGQENVIDIGGTEKSGSTESRKCWQHQVCSEWHAHHNLCVPYGVFGDGDPVLGLFPLGRLVVDIGDDDSQIHGTAPVTAVCSDDLLVDTGCLQGITEPSCELINIRTCFRFCVIGLKKQLTQSIRKNETESEIPNLTVQWGEDIYTMHHTSVKYTKLCIQMLAMIHTET